MTERYYFYEDPELGFIACDSKLQEQLYVFFTESAAIDFVNNLNNENNQ